MVDQADCKTMLTRLGWKNSASPLMYDNHTISSINEFKSLDNGSVKTLCKVLRRPRCVTATGALDPGVKVNARDQSNLMLDVYLIKNQYRVSRDVTFRNVTLSGVRKFSSQREMEEYATEGSVATPMVYIKDWSNMLEVVEEYLRTFHGANGTPL